MVKANIDELQQPLQSVVYSLVSADTCLPGSQQNFFWDIRRI